MRFYMKTKDLPRQTVNGSDGSNNVHNSFYAFYYAPQYNHKSYYLKRAHLEETRLTTPIKSIKVSQ